jgi:RES domain-containing protein
MKVYRIAKSTYIHDLSGMGAREFGGRWNHKGTSIVYTSESRPLAILECLVNLPMPVSPKALDLKIAAIVIADDIIPKRISISDLPSNWRDYPAPLELADIGTKWARKKETLLLRVPSAIVHQEFNILINPLHPDIRRVKISHIEDYRINHRLLREKKRG